MNIVKEFRTYLTDEKESFSAFCFSLQKDNVDHRTSVLNSILTLQRNYEGKAKMMDTISQKMQKIVHEARFEECSL